MKELQGGITAVPGFLAAGMHCGIKKEGRPDLAVMVSEKEAAVAGMFTTHRFAAPPLILCRKRLAGRGGGRGRAIVVTSGNANACTGRQGVRDAEKIVTLAARGLGVSPRLVYVASTGVIGQPLPMEKIRPAIPRVLRRASRAGGHEAATAILTTDTHTKEVAVCDRIGGRTVTVGGIAKGSGMIYPKMTATMLAFLGTDAMISGTTLQRVLTRAVDCSFNMITVDGETSTNDTVLCFANGLAGGPPLRSDAEVARFEALVTHVCLSLARMIVRDGEGATKCVEITVCGARTAADARTAALAVARSPLVKTALFGADPNWGRIMAALGASGAWAVEEKTGISFNGVTVVTGGKGLGKKAEEKAATSLKKKDIFLTIHLGVGRAMASLLTTDLSPEYVTINAAYRS